jgi:hypothetical protein
MPCLILSYVPAHCIVLFLVPAYFVLVYEYISTGKYNNIAYCTGNPHVFDRSYWLALYGALCY